jgi:hypothetical protein
MQNVKSEHIALLRKMAEEKIQRNLKVKSVPLSAARCRSLVETQINDRDSDKVLWMLVLSHTSGTSVELTSSTQHSIVHTLHKMSA